MEEQIRILYFHLCEAVAQTGMYPEDQAQELYRLIEEHKSEVASVGRSPKEYEGLYSWATEIFR